jgi:hypothetical protein
MSSEEQDWYLESQSARQVLHRLILMGPNRLLQFDYLYTLITTGLFG